MSDTTTDSRLTITCRDVSAAQNLAINAPGCELEAKRGNTITVSGSRDHMAALLERLKQRGAIGGFSFACAHAGLTRFPRP